MSNQTTYKDTTNAISLEGSGCGSTHSDKAIGPMTDLFGQEVAHANPSPKPHKPDLELKPRVISGLSSTASSGSVRLQQSLENRCVRTTGSIGSMVYTQTWKRVTTPLGRSFLAHTARKAHTKDKECTGLEKGTYATPVCADGTGGPRPVRINKNGRAVRYSKETGQEFGICLADQAKLSALKVIIDQLEKGNYVTPTTKGYEMGDSFWKEANRQLKRGKPCLIAQVALSVWPEGVYPTPTMRDYKGKNDVANTIAKLEQGKRAHMGQLANFVPVNMATTKTIRLTKNGIQIGSCCEIKSGTQLNPYLSLWLMGLPTEYLSSKLLEMPFKRKRQKSS